MAIKLVTFFIFLLIYSQLGFSDQKLLLVGDNNNFPVCFENEDGTIIGIDVDIIKEIAQRIELDIDIKLAPWPRVLFMVKNGKAHGGFPFFVTPERLEFSSYTKIPLHRSVFMAFAKPGNEFNFEKISDLHGKVVGINRGFSISPEFDAAVNNGSLNVYGVDEIHQLVEMLMKNRIDVIVAKRSTIAGYLKNTGQKLTPLGAVNKGQGAFLVISKAAKIENKERILQKIDEVMAEMEVDGTIAKITKKYIE